MQLSDSRAWELILYRLPHFQRKGAKAGLYLTHQTRLSHYKISIFSTFIISYRSPTQYIMLLNLTGCGLDFEFAYWNKPRLKIVV